MVIQACFQGGMHSVRTSHYGYRAGRAATFVAALISATLISQCMLRAQCALGQFTYDPPSAGDKFGRSVSVSKVGDELVVGTRFAASVFVRDYNQSPGDPVDDTWVHQFVILTQEVFDDFGASVYLHGDRLIVGAPAHGGVAGQGAAFIYRRMPGLLPDSKTDDSWTFEAKLQGLPLAQLQRVGTSVTLIDDWAFVGAPFGYLPPGQTAASAGGVTYVFRRVASIQPGPPGDAWDLHTVLLGSGPAAMGGSFGEAAAAEGHHLLVGAPGEQPFGAVYHFVRTDGGTPSDTSDDAWHEQARIAPTASIPGLRNFGWALAIDGRRALVGAWGAAFELRLDESDTPSNPSDDVFVEHSVLVPSDSSPNSNIIGAVALRADYALLGAENALIGLPGASGAAYVFRRLDSAVPSATPGVEWLEVGKLASIQPQSQKFFGAAVGLAFDHAIVGQQGQFFATPADSFNGAVDYYALATGPWSYISAGLAGGHGKPCLLGTGPLIAGTATKLTLIQAAPVSATAIVIGLSAVNLPLKGGVLVPMPAYVLWATTDSAGALALSLPWPTGAWSGLALYFQTWIPDVTGPAGYTSSNAVHASAR